MLVSQLSYYLRVKKAFEKLKKEFAEGLFFNYSEHKQQKFLRKFNNYSWKLGLKRTFTAATLCLAFGITTNAQSFVEKTGAENPLNGISVAGGAGRFIIPSLVDIDNDGDLDLFVGYYDFDTYYGVIDYYKNNGTAEAPVFEHQAGAANPLSSISEYYGSFDPNFADLDDDGDMDLVAQAYSGNILYYKNTGTADSPAFTEQIGADNPFAGIDGGNMLGSALGDVDGDGDIDFILSNRTESQWHFDYYKNTGTVEAPMYTLQEDDDALFEMTALGEYSIPRAELVDLDGDGDLDFVVGEKLGTLIYFKNTGTETEPVFVLTQGADSPVDGIDIAAESDIADGRAAPAFGDLDNDGDLEIVIGHQDGHFLYFDATMPTTITDNFKKGGLSLYPNPSVNVLYLKTDELVAYSIYDIAGNIVAQGQYANGIDVANLSEGLYILKTEYGTQSFVKK